jgi:6-phosphogluconolactonase (cycloisomerase 2 family)
LRESPDRRSRRATRQAVYSIDATTGALKQIAASPIAAGTKPQGIGFDRTGKFVYATNYNGGNLSEYAFDANTGELTPAAGSPLATCGHPEGIQAHPTLNRLYVECSSAIAVYDIDASTGALTAIAGSPFKASSGSQNAAMDPAGHFLYRTNSALSDVAISRIDPSSGALTPIKGSPFALPYTPDFIVVADER